MTTEDIKNLNSAYGMDMVALSCYDEHGDYLGHIKATDIIDHINKQNAEIKRLKDLCECVKVSKDIAVSEGIKEFVKKLKKKAMCNVYHESYDNEEYEYKIYTVDFDDIDDVLKEMEVQG